MRYVNRRLYTRYCSQHLVPSLFAILLFALSLTPFARVHVEYAVNQNLVFTMRYLGLLLLVTGFRASIPSLKAVHKIVAVLLGMVPSMFLMLFTWGLLMMVIIGGLFVALGADGASVITTGSMQIILLWMASLIVTTGVWTLIVRAVFFLYRCPYELDDESGYASVAFLVMFLGVFGGHRFFVGRIASGLVYLATFGFLGLGVVVDAVVLMLGRFKDSEGHIV